MYTKIYVNLTKICLLLKYTLYTYNEHIEVVISFKTSDCTGFYNTRTLMQVVKSLMAHHI